MICSSACSFVGSALDMAPQPGPITHFSEVFVNITLVLGHDGSNKGGPGREFHRAVRVERGLPVGHRPDEHEVFRPLDSPGNKCSRAGGKILRRDRDRVSLFSSNFCLKFRLWCGRIYSLKLKWSRDLAMTGIGTRTPGCRDRDRNRDRDPPPSLDDSCFFKGCSLMSQIIGTRTIKAFGDRHP